MCVKVEIWGSIVSYLFQIWCKYAECAQTVEIHLHCSPPPSLSKYFTATSFQFCRGIASSMFL